MDRWDSLAPFIKKNKGSLLDIGCNIGFFSFQSASVGRLAFGIEANPLYVTLCNAIKIGTGEKNCFFY